MGEGKSREGVAAEGTEGTEGTQGVRSGVFERAAAAVTLRHSGRARKKACCGGVRSSSGAVSGVMEASVAAIDWVDMRVSWSVGGRGAPAQE
jgi:hypothetical protein